MGNPSKDKGDRYEREGVRYFIDLCPDLLVWNAQRFLGAGRKEDIGDLLIFPDAAVQVKAYAETRLSAGLYSAATGATIQAKRARHPFALGLVLVPRARLVGAVRWMASVEQWPVELGDHVVYSSSIAAFNAVKAAGLNSDLIARVERKGVNPIIMSSLQTWVGAYRVATGRPVPS